VTRKIHLHETAEAGRWCARAPRAISRHAFLATAFPMMLTVFVAAAMLAAGGAAAWAQTPGVVGGPVAQSASKGLTAIESVARADKYLFVFFWRDQNPQTDAMWEALQSAMAKHAARAESVAVRVSDPAEQAVVSKFGVDRAPMPLVLAVAPTGAVTKGFCSAFTEDQFVQAFVSPGTARVLKGVQSRKLVLVCVESRQALIRPVSLKQGVAEFAADPDYGGATDVVVIDPADAGEASLLKSLNVDPQAEGGTTVLIAPPGTIVGGFTGEVTKAQLIAKLQAAQSNPCAGGKCGPGGCCPKK